MFTLLLKKRFHSHARTCEWSRFNVSFAVRNQFIEQSGAYGFVKVPFHKHRMKGRVAVA